MASDLHKPQLLILGAPPRGGNHLLRGLLDNHPQLLLPPDEDYFIRHLSRSALLRWRGMLCNNAAAPGFYRELQKNGHLERINAGHGTEVFGSEDSLNLEAYYGYLRTHHERGSVDVLVRNHIEALAVALGHRTGDQRLRVFFCALQPSNRDLSAVGELLSRSFRVRGIFLIRDPRAHLSSKLVRNPTLNLRRFCQRQNRFWHEMDWFEQHCGPVLRLRFEELVTETRSKMQEVCDFAGITFRDSVLEYTQGGRPSVSNSSFGASAGIDNAALTRYRDTLPPDTIAYLEEHCLPDLFWRPRVSEPTASDAGAQATPYTP
ncbi:MAG: sulfotransferase [Halieaceae bacterium]|jgi:hypothetical protein|nr:sulfotransferase [Halieaceae bacterium]